MPLYSDHDRLNAARRIVEHVGALIDARFSVRLWDGSTIPLGRNVDTDFQVAINGPGVIGALLRRPTYENLLAHYVRGRIDLHGDLIDFAAVAREKRPRQRLKQFDRLYLLKQLLPLLLARKDEAALAHGYADDAVGRAESRRDNRAFIRFHYDLSNEFYALFLDEAMQYSCAYFTEQGNTLDQAQRDKLRSSAAAPACAGRAVPGYRLRLGRAGLLRGAALRGARARRDLVAGQLDYARAKIQRLGLTDRVTVELRDYATLDGEYDKIASVGMFEHIGIANMPKNFGKLNSLLRDRGLLLNHGISRRAKRSRRAARRIRPERRMLLKYVFPGSELDNVGHTIDTMETCGFEVRDVEAWREHYALTTRHWYRRLMTRRDEAIRFVASRGSDVGALPRRRLRRLRQRLDAHLPVLASKHGSKGPSGVPLTRVDLYA